MHTKEKEALLAMLDSLAQNEMNYLKTMLSDDGDRQLELQFETHQTESDSSPAWETEKTPKIECDKDLDLCPCGGATDFRGTALICNKCGKVCGGF